MENNIFFNSYSLKEIILILSDIDLKINALTECSAIDFLTLNKHLKKYYRQASSISSNASQIFNIFLGEENQHFVTKLNEYQIKLQKSISEFASEMEEKMQRCEKILMHLNLMYIPFKNFNQNVMTFSFLVTNLKLNIAYFDKEKCNFLNSELESIDLIIKEIKNFNSNFTEKIGNLKSALRFTNSKCEEIRERTLKNMQVVHNQLVESVHLLLGKHEEVTSYKADLSQNSNSYFENVSEIIKNLQYQDIIRQKMEHMLEIHKDVIKDLTVLENSESQESISKQQMLYYMKIRDIAGLQMSQLIFTNNEYQNAIESIIRNFLEAADHLYSISQLCFHITGHHFWLTENYFKEMSSKMSNVHQLLQRFSETKEELSRIYSQLESHIDVFLSEFHQINNFDERIKVEAANISQKIRQIPDSEKEFSTILHQINEVSNNIFANMQSIKQHFSQILRIPLKFSLSKDNFLFSSNDFYNLLSKLNENNEKINLLLSQNTEWSTKIITEMKTSIEEVKYYDFFEKVIDEIIQELNEIYSKLSYSNGASQKFENLKDLETHYTMESERFILHQVSLLNELEKIDGNIENNDGDVEFF